MLLEEVSIRSLVQDDYPRCAQIYRAGIATGIATFEITVPDWEQWDAKFLPSCRCVALLAGKVVGWIALTPFSERMVYKGVAEVSLYIDQAHRKKGIGGTLLDYLIIQSEAQGFWTLQAKIFPQNSASVRLFEKAGFRHVGIREKIAQRDGIWHDNVLLERRSSIKQT